MYYHIHGFLPRIDADIFLSCYNFGIGLAPEWKKIVSDSGLTQDNINSFISRMGNIFLDSYNFNKKYKDGGKERRLYEARFDIRIAWGEWGPEHITVPGNACGLDICSGISAPPGGRYLAPHNIDTLNQACLLLSIFLYFADTLIIRDRAAKLGIK